MTKRDQDIQNSLHILCNKVLYLNQFLKLNQKIVPNL